MKRLLIISLALILLLCSCSGEHKFKRLADGSGYTDTKSDLVYKMLDVAFEPGSAGKTVGTYTDKALDVTVVFHEIPSLDATLFLTDEDHNVYYAGEKELDPATLRKEDVLVCEGDAVSIERNRFTGKEDGATVSAICDLWFEGEEAGFLSVKEADKIYGIKLSLKDYPNLYYCFNFLYFEGDTCYFHQPVSHRSVVVPDELVALLRAAEVA